MLETLKTLLPTKRTTNVSMVLIKTKIKGELLMANEKNEFPLDRVNTLYIMHNALFKLIYSYCYL